MCRQLRKVMQVINEQNLRLSLLIQELLIGSFLVFN